MQLDQPDNGSPKRAVFTRGGKGDVGKTEVALALASWYRARGIEPVLLDFDIENSNKSGFQSFFPDAEKISIHKEGSLDAFFHGFRVRRARGSRGSRRRFVECGTGVV